MICANCACDISHASCIGTSSIYHPGPNSFELCEECFHEEDDLIESTGTNINPERLRIYAVNQPQNINH